MQMLHLVEPHLRRGAIAVADDIAQFPADLADLVAYIDPKNGFRTMRLPLGGSSLVAVRG